MKFNLNLPSLESRKTRSTIKSIRKPKIDTRTVETWNELRLIGIEGAFRKHFAKSEGVVVEDEDEAVIMQEAQDWDNLIAQFNEQYRQQLKQGFHHDNEDEESISTLAETKSELLRKRNRRRIIYRKLFIMSCLFLWVTALWGNNQWQLVYQVYPIGFLQQLEIGVIADVFTEKAGWAVLASNFVIWLVGCLGVLLAICFQHKPQLLRQFILRAPMILIVPVMMILVSVRFTGLVSTENLKDVLEVAISKYHDNLKPETQQFYVEEWDKLQRFLLCCGVNSASDWEGVDNNLQADSTYLPASCCPKKFFRDNWKQAPPMRDDCFYKINRQLYEWAYPTPCLEVAYQFYQRQSVLQVLVSFFQFLNLVACFVAGKALYATTIKCSDLRFKYSWKRYLLELFYLDLCCIFIGCCCRIPICGKVCPRKCDPNYKSKKRDRHVNVVSKPSGSVLLSDVAVLKEPKEGARKSISFPNLDVLKSRDSKTDTDLNEVVVEEKGDDTGSVKDTEAAGADPPTEEERKESTDIPKDPLKENTKTKAKGPKVRRPKSKPKKLSSSTSSVGQTQVDTSQTTTQTSEVPSSNVVEDSMMDIFNEGKAESNEGSSSGPKKRKKKGLNVARGRSQKITSSKRKKKSN